MACVALCLPASGIAKTESEAFTLLQLNTWRAGANVPDGHKGIVDVIAETNPDIAFLCEVNGNATISKIVADLAERGINYYGEGFDLNVGLLSKIKPDTLITCCTVPGDEIRTMLKAVIRINGQPISFYSAHIDHRNYACYLPRGYNGATWEKGDSIITDESQVLEANRLSFREESIEAFLKHAQADMAAGIPVVIGGDFNEPSHLDWQANTKDLFDHNGAIIHWDCSMMLHNAGFVDTFREKYPDAVKWPGSTYPAGNKWAKLEELSWTPDADERERIDFIYYFPADSALTLSDSKLIGPNQSVVHYKIVDTPDADYIITPNSVWPSDHKGNLATFKIANQK